MASRLTLAVLDLVFPALCPVCQVILDADRRDPLCGRCWCSITRLGPPGCDVCGAASPTVVSFTGSQRVEHGREGARAAAGAGSGASGVFEAPDPAPAPGPAARPPASSLPGRP